MEEEKIWLERLIIHIEQPEKAEMQFLVVRRYALLTIIFAVIALALSSLLTQKPLIFAIGGFMIGMIFMFRTSAEQVRSNMARTKPYLNKEAIKKRLEELNNIKNS